MSWICAWEQIYGVYPTSRATKPDDEPFVITAEGDKICKKCADTWQEGRKKQLKGSEK